jgi:PIN domain nuclease of toxin-antitoxin system
VLLWSAAGTLGGEWRAHIESADTVSVSAASVWEIEIKRAAGRLRAPDDVAERALSEGYEPLTISFEHALEAGRLPRVHGDPFDRMLIAQARIEGMTLATADATIVRYDVQTLQVAQA